MGNSRAFVVGSGVTVNGVNGTLSANAGTAGGSGGTISVTSTSIGGITINDPGDLTASASAQGGSGGSISLASSGGTVSIAGGGITDQMNLSGDGAGAFAGGTLKVTSLTFTVSTQALYINANGAGTGNGGTITIGSSAVNSSITLGTAAGQIALSATGGSSLSLAGNGGTVAITAGLNVIVNDPGTPTLPGTLNVSPLGTNGNGGSISLTGSASGQPGSSGFLITGSLDEQGVGTGSGGKVAISINNNQIFSIGSATATTGITGIATGRNAGASMYPVDRLAVAAVPFP